MLRPRIPSALLALLPLAWHAPAGAQENVLLLLADDLGVEALASYGLRSDTPSTPNLDALAAGGVRFDNAWATPLCSPTRAALLTGRHGFRTGIGYIVDLQFGLQPDEVTLPELLDLGTGGAWAHAAIGKWHLGSDASIGGLSAPNVAGFAHFAGTMANLDRPDETFFGFPKTVNGVQTQVDAYAPTEKVDDALAWIATAPEPWLLYLPFHLPHKPFHAPPAHLHGVSLPGPFDPETSDPRPYFEAMVEALDTEIGRLLAGIPPATLARTTVLFLGDNGTDKAVIAAPYDADHAKGTVYQGGVRVPLIASGPRVGEPGRAVDALVGVTDVFATLAELAGVELGATPELAGLELDSVSFLPWIEGAVPQPSGRGSARAALPTLAPLAAGGPLLAAASPGAIAAPPPAQAAAPGPSAPEARRLLYTERFLPNGFAAQVNGRRALRDGRYKLVQRDFPFTEELFDLAVDPLEADNLLRQGTLTAEQAAAYDALHASMAALRSR